MKHHFWAVPAVAGALCVCGCVNTNSAGTVTAIDLPAAIERLTLADLEAADTDAVAHGDTVAAMCYAALIPLVSTARAPAAPVGLVSAFQDLRDGVGSTVAATGLLKQLEVPCGPLAADVNLTLIQLVGKFAPAVLD
jgi:hypothetical protein